ncbi:uncharacterized protein LOC116806049 [Drosophila grimshawi]|uniref:uncharacterized protein LOC116806049 n=1 Tax=Drosophila grimshawi TaxID=7222 RepID=UPI001C934344|nr:uncharacterized protein LOC116806049 [Drosophila grimshawi]
MTKRAIIFLVMCLNLPCRLTKKYEKCDDNTTETSGGTAYWKFRGERYTTSEDFVCWKDDWELFLRECDTTTGQWKPESVVCRVKEHQNKYCPEELVEVDNESDDPICLKASSERKKYDEHFCYGSSIILPFDYSKLEASSLIEFMHDRGILEFWLPFKRENNSMPYKVQLPGERWGQVVDDKIEVSDFRSDKNCMSGRLESHNKKKKELIVMATDCDDLLHTICVFDGNLISSTGCPDGLAALSYRPNECYGINWPKKLSGEQKEVRLKEYFQNRNTLRLMLKHGIRRVEKEEFFEVDHFVDKSGDGFLILMNQNEIMRIVDNDKKTHPILYKETIKNQFNTTQLILKFDATLQELILIVYNSDYLWRINRNHNGIQCFTNADFDIQRSSKIDLIWENKNKTKLIFKLKLVNDNPGEYWCEGHSILNFQLVTTERIVAAKKIRGHAFAARINITCINENKNMCKNPFKYTKKLGKHVQDTLRRRSKVVARDLVIHDTRIMSIEQISSPYVHCWIHLTASLKNSAVDNSEEESSEESDSLENDDNIRHDTSIRMGVWTLLQEVISIFSPNGLNVVRSTEYCFPNMFRLDTGVIYQWQQTVRGQVGTLSGLCFRSNGMPYTRRCQGNFLHGAYWELMKENITCQLEHNNLKVTETLYSLEKSKLIKVSPERVVKEVKHILQESAKKFLPVDLHLAANIVQASINNVDRNILNLPPTHNFFKETTLDLIAIYNYLIDVRESTIRMSAKLNSTNKLLEAFENAMNTLSLQTVFGDTGLSNPVDNSNELDNSSDVEVLDYVDIGVSVKISHNLIYFIINPSIANISGIAIFQNNNNSDIPITLKGAFKNEHFRFLESDYEIEDLISEPNLQFGTYVPEKLLSQLDTISNAPNATKNTKTLVVIKVYSNDKLFQLPANHTPLSAFGRVVSISLPGHSPHLPEDLPLAFRVYNSSYKHNDTTQMCSYWNYENWASDGIQVSNLLSTNRDIVLCQVSHLTPFAYLVGVNFTVEEDIEVNIQYADHVQALDIITVTGCSLSLLGICGIFITAAVFNSWRQKPSSKVLLQLSAAIALQMIILCFVNTKEYSLHLIINEIVPRCVAIGALLHYSVLVQFFWMMVIAYLQFKRYVQVFAGTRPHRFFMKSAAFCWGVPIIPVVLVIILDHDSFSKGAICYPSGYALYFGIIFPISIIIIANFVIFCLIIYNILVRSSVPIRHTEKPILIYQIRLSVLLFFLMGFTWCFGFLSTMKAGIVFSYFFCLTATLQGFVIFVYFIILDPVTRRMWGEFLCKLCSIDKSFLQSTGSVKDTTETY